MRSSSDRTDVFCLNFEALDPYSMDQNGSNKRAKIPRFFIL